MRPREFHDACRAILTALSLARQRIQVDGGVFSRRCSDQRVSDAAFFGAAQRARSFGSIGRCSDREDFPVMYRDHLWTRR
jgi:hypothetical protein